MLESWLRRLARTIDANPRRIAIACLLAALLAAAVVVRIPVTTELLDVMPGRAPAIVAFTDFLRDFGVLNGLVIVVETQETSAETLLAVVESLGERLSASAAVASVDYNALRSGFRFVAEHFPVYLDDGAVARLSRRLTPGGIQAQITRNREALLSPVAFPFEAEAIGKDPLDIRALVRDSLVTRVSTGALDLSTGYYLDRSHRLALLMVRPRGSTRDLSFVRSLEEEVRRIAAEVIAAEGDPRTIRVGLAGGYARAAEAVAVIWQDMLLSFGVSLVLVVFLLWAAFRPSIIVIGVFVATLFAALAWTLWLAYLLYGTLNIVTSIVAAMLVGLFVDYNIHVYQRFRESFRANGRTAQALETTLTGTGKAILSGALTTALSFFSVVVTSFRGMHELGVVAGCGVLVCLLATLVFMTALLTWLAQSRPTRLLAGRPVDLGAGWAARLVARRGGALTIGFVLLVAIAVWGATLVRFDASLESLGLRDSAVQAVEETLQRVLGRSGEPLFVVVRGADDGQIARDFDALDRQGARWRAQGTIGGFASAGLLLPPPSRQRQTLARLAAEGLPGRFDGPGLAKLVRTEMGRQGMVADAALDGYAAGIVRALSAGEVVGLAELARTQDPRAAYYYHHDRRALAAHLTPPGSGWDRATLSALEADVRLLGAGFRLVGPAVFLEQIRATILWEAGLAVVLSFAANLCIVRFHFQNWRRVWLVMVPVTVGAILTVGSMGVLGMRFNFFNVAGIALIFGFGVDYGIYLMQAHVEGNSACGADAVRSVGGGVILCAVTTLASCGSLITTHYRGLASIGAVLCLGTLFCLATTLLLLPPLMGRFGKTGIRP
jgi:predicted RND superfamily exporter protein